MASVGFREEDEPGGEEAYGGPNPALIEARVRGTGLNPVSRFGRLPSGKKKATAIHKGLRPLRAQERRRTGEEGTGAIC